MSILQKPLKDALFLLFRSMRPGLSGKASILVYHSISDSQAFFAVRKGAFERQLAYITSRGYEVVFLSELVRRLGAGEDISNCVSLTFEDGYLDAYETVFPLLQQYGCKATFFPIMELLGSSIETSKGDRFDTLSPRHIKEMQESGLCEFMAHLPHYQPLDEVRADQAFEAMELARKDTEGVTGARAAIFSYPKGRYSDELIEHLRESDWDAAVTLREGLVEPGTERYALPRNAVDSKTTFTQFKGKLSGAIELYRSFKRR